MNIAQAAFGTVVGPTILANETEGTRDGSTTVAEGSISTKESAPIQTHRGRRNRAHGFRPGHDLAAEARTTMMKGRRRRTDGKKTMASYCRWASDVSAVSN
jgi:hypothetical protein